MSSSVPTADPSPPIGQPPSETDLLRETVTTMALCGRSFDEVAAMLATSATGRETSLDNEYQQRIFSARGQIGEIERQINAVETDVSKAKEAAVQQVSLEHDKRSIERRIDVLRTDVERKRLALERERHKAAVEEASQRLHSTEEKLSEQRKIALAEQMEAWQRQRQEDFTRADVESQMLGEIEEALRAARARVKPLLDQHITKTVAGFLLWVGYGSFAAIGATLALLLPKISDGESPLAQIITAVRMVVGGYATGRQPWQVLGFSIGFVLLLLIGFVGVVWANDWLLQRFDLDWRSEARRFKKSGKKKGERRQNDVTFQPVEIRRTSYVQLLATLPYILITGVIVCLLSVANEPPGPAAVGLASSQIPAAKSSVSNSIVGTYLGTVIALLMTASFALYIVKVIDRREAAAPNEDAAQRRKRWFRGWEFLVIPLIAIGGVIYATAMAREDRGDWGVLAVFMLVSCIAVAYGVIYRGLFYDVDKLERDRRRSLKLIADLRAVEVPDLDPTDEIKDTQETLRREREELQELDSLRFPGLHEEGEPSARSWFKRARPARPPRYSSKAFAVSDTDAAPGEVDDIKRLHDDLARIDRELASVRVDTNSVDMKALIARREDLQRELNARRAAAEALEFERKRALWELRNRQEMQAIDLRGVFELAVAARTFMPPRPPFAGGPK